MFILGVDCAWTTKEPSGVVLIKNLQNKKAELIKIGRSYNEFCSDEIKWQEPVKGAAPDFHALLQYCSDNGWDVDLLALDIPLSPNLITERRSCDNEVSKAYGAKGAAVHTPSELRPGRLAVEIYKQLEDAGYKWNGDTNEEKVFIEVYPHASIIELLKLKYRLPYKVQKSKKYWPDASAEQRNNNIIENLSILKSVISEYITNTDKLPNLNRNIIYPKRFLKGYEDILDVLICAITGLFYFEGNIKGYGNTDERIWVAL